MGRWGRWIRAIVILLAVVGLASRSDGQEWTEEAARKEVFRDIRWMIDPALYPAKDPDYEENQQAMRDRGSGKVRDRFVSANPPGAEPGYVVSKLQSDGLPDMSMQFAPDGRSVSARLFSVEDYPRAAYIYCLSSDCPVTGERRQARPGELVSLSFHPSATEVFYLDVQGRLTMHRKD